MHARSSTRILQERSLHMHIPETQLSDGVVKLNTVAQMLIVRWLDTCKHRARSVCGTVHSKLKSR